MNFKELFEAKKATAASIKKVIKNSGLEVLYPEAFEVEKKNTDAGVGGYDYFQITARNLRAKDLQDTAIVLDALQKNFKGVKLIRDDNSANFTVRLDA